MIGRRKERIDFKDLVNEFNEEQQQLDAPWRMATGNGENGSLKLALWKLDSRKNSNTQKNCPGQIPSTSYGLHAYRPGFKNPISGQVVKLDPKDPQFMGIRHSLEYLAHRSGKTITPDSITSGPEDHHRRNHKLVEIFDLRRGSLIHKARQRFNGKKTDQ